VVLQPTEADAFLFQPDAVADQVVAQGCEQLLFVVAEAGELSGEATVPGFAGPHWLVRIQRGAVHQQ